MVGSEMEAAAMFVREQRATLDYIVADEAGLADELDRVVATIDALDAREPHALTPEHRPVILAAIEDAAEGLLTGGWGEAVAIQAMRGLLAALEVVPA